MKPDIEGIYLDHAATTYIREEVLEEMKPYLGDKFGNASSIYKLGMESRLVIEESRRKIAEIINADVNEIFFTSGGSESDNWAIMGVAMNNFNNDIHIITSQIEHSAVYNTCKYLESKMAKITYLPVNENGIVDISNLQEEIRYDTRLISVMYANNEIGSIQPIKEIAKIAKDNDILFHTDAVQAIGNTRIDVKDLGIDMMSISGHKFYGPKGIGVLYIKKGTPIDSYIHGGGQEFENRAGTENIASIVGMRKAMELAYKNIDINRNNIDTLRRMFISDVLKNIPNCKINGSLDNTLPGIVNITFDGINAETLLLLLNAKDIYASAGSACSSHSNSPSRVLTAIGLSEKEANSSVRFSFGLMTTENQLKYTVSALKDAVSYLRSFN